MIFKSKKEQIQNDAEINIKHFLKDQGLPEEEVKLAIDKLRKKVESDPLPKIAMIGFTGVGKSSTLNALFNAGQPTDDIRACTQNEAPIIGDVLKYTGSKGSVVIYDMPGLGEDIKADKKHLETYLKVLPVVDIAVWTFHTGDRSMTPMQAALLELIKYLGNDFSKKLMFAINKADAIAPGESDWNTQLNSPSPRQRANITSLEQYITEKIHQVLPEWNGSIVTYSAKKRFRLEQLMTAMVETMDHQTRYKLGWVADVADTTEFIDARYREIINSYRKG